MREDFSVFLKGAFFSVKGKILLLAVSVAFFTSFLIGALYYFQLVKLTLEKETDKLAAETRLMVPQFKAIFSDMRSDVRVISKTPPIQGLMRSINNGGIDPLDGSTTAQWRARLAEIFKSVAQSNEAYVQVRYIGVADGGRELVRVNRTENSVQEVPYEYLQQKGDEPYFKVGLGLLPGDVYFSVVNLNRENGKIQEPYLPVMRTISPVHDNKGKLFGMIVTNVSYKKLLEGGVNSLGLERDVFVTDNTGDYLVYTKEGEISGYKLGGLKQDYRENAPVVAAITSATPQEGTLFKVIEGQYFVIHYFKLFFDPTDHTRFLNMALTTPREEFFKNVYKARRYGLLLGGMLVFVSSVMAALLARLFTEPLNQISREIKAYDAGEKNLSLPTHRQDELGNMARAFDRLVKNLDESQERTSVYLAALENSNQELDDFAYIASHDLKEPLRGLVNNALFLKEDYNVSLDENGKKRLNRMEYLCKRMEALVDDLLYFSRLGRQDLAIQSIDLNEVIKDIEDMMQVTFEEKNARISIPKRLPEIVCDRLRFTEVFRNLVTNAVKYNISDEKIVEIGCANTSDFEQAHNATHVFYVKDNGIGINAAFYKDIFRIFKRLNVEEENMRGTGAGLTFVKKIVERHGGKIWFSSEEGRGTTFYFTLIEKKVG